MYDNLEGQGVQSSAATAQLLGEQVAAFVASLVRQLDAVLDKRLVRTFVRILVAIVTLRQSNRGLLLSELGGVLLSPQHAPAGTKRISNLLRSPRWEHTLIEQFLWQQAQARVEQLTQAGELCLVVWDESVLEKAESLQLEGLCAVRSSVAQRLKRIKPGYYHPPSEPIFVPGLQWLGLLVLGLSGAPTLAAMRWWTRRGKFATDRHTLEQALLDQAVQAWGAQVVHIFDRGFAGRPWLGALLEQPVPPVRFVVRWPARYHLFDAQGRKRPAWQSLLGKRTWAYRPLWDAHRQCQRRVPMGRSCVAVPVRHPDFPDVPLWLVASRQGQGRRPWYLLTNLPVQHPPQAWQVIIAYARRWQIEQTWRYTKSELAMESPRLWAWANRLKLLLIASLAYAFLLSLLDPSLLPLRIWLLRTWCHRTGKRCQVASAPLYRLRAALAALWLAYPPAIPPLNSG